MKTLNSLIISIQTKLNQMKWNIFMKKQIGNWKGSIIWKKNEFFSMKLCYMRFVNNLLRQQFYEIFKNPYMYVQCALRYLTFYRWRWRWCSRTRRTRTWWRNNNRSPYHRCCRQNGQYIACNHSRFGCGLLFGEFQLIIIVLD